jgi:hypothetical protein
MQEPVTHHDLRAELAASSYPTSDLVAMALSWYDRPTGRDAIWRYVSSYGSHAAYDFLMVRLDEDERRENAVDALVAAGWSLRSINEKHS